MGETAEGRRGAAHTPQSSREKTAPVAPLTDSKNAFKLKVCISNSCLRRAAAPQTSGSARNSPEGVLQPKPRPALCQIHT